MKTQTIYKIQHKDSGKFSTGGSHPTFTPGGKIWKRMGDLKSHLRLCVSGCYKNCEIVSFDIVESHRICILGTMEQIKSDSELRKKEQQEYNRIRLMEKLEREILEKKKSLDEMKRIAKARPFNHIYAPGTK